MKLETISERMHELGPVVSVISGVLGSTTYSNATNLELYIDYITSLGALQKNSYGLELLKRSVDEIIVGAGIGLLIYGANSLYRNIKDKK